MPLRNNVSPINQRAHYFLDLFQCLVGDNASPAQNPVDALGLLQLAHDLRVPGQSTFRRRHRDVICQSAVGSSNRNHGQVVSRPIKAIVGDHQAGPDASLLASYLGAESKNQTSPALGSPVLGTDLLHFFQTEIPLLMLETIHRSPLEEGNLLPILPPGYWIGAQPLD